MELDGTIILFLLIGAIVLMAAVGFVMKVFWKVGGVIILFALLAFIFTGATPRDLWHQADKITDGAGRGITNNFACPNDAVTLIEKISAQQARIQALNAQLKTVPEKSESASKIRGQIVIAESELKRLRYCQGKMAVS